MSYYSDDPGHDFDLYDSDLQAELDRLPKCCCCDNYSRNSNDGPHNGRPIRPISIVILHINGIIKTVCKNVVS